MKDRLHALRIVCRELALLQAFNPPLLDSNDEPRGGAEDQKIEGLFEKIDKEDTDNPPPGGNRVDRFVRRLDHSINWSFALSPSELIDDQYPTIKLLVNQIMDS
jgi:hypothetical protein